MTMANDKLFEFCFDELIILTEETLVLGIIHPETDVCLGTLDIRTVMPLETKVNRKRALSTRSSVSKKKVFLCNYCEYQSNAKYMTDRHVARIQEKCVEPQVCSFCKFSNLYSFNMKRHIMRSHANRQMKTPMSDSSSCDLRRSSRKTVIELSDSSILLS